MGSTFGGVTASGHEPNLAYPGSERDESIHMMQECIDAAVRAGAYYVNIHTGTRCLCTLNFENHELLPNPSLPIISDAESAALRHGALELLCGEAAAKKILFLVEPIPARLHDGDWRSREARIAPLEAYVTSLAGLRSLCESGLLGITNDFCHTFSMEHDAPREKLVEKFFAVSRQLAPFTRVVHVNTLTPPYSGTDEHRGILEEDLCAEGVFPSKEELFQAFSMLASNEHDVLLVGEPAAKHVEDFQALKRLIKEFQGTT